MTAKSIGRKTLFRFITLSVVSILALYIGTFLLFADPAVITVSLENVVSTLHKELVNNIGFVATQFLLLIVQVYFIGSYIGESIITRRKNFAVIGGLSIFLIWFILFVACAITGGIINSIKYGFDGFVSAFMNWVVFGMLPFLFFGAVHGLTLGYFLGRAIKKKGAS